MCGIVGVYGLKPSSSASSVQKLIDRLLVAAESRGKEAAGVAVETSTDLRIYKTAVRATRMLKEPAYRDLWRDIRNGDTSIQAVVGHSRLVTNGSEACAANNQPVFRDGIAVIHNGIITNVDALWSRYSFLDRQSEVDTEILPALLSHLLTQIDDIAEVVRRLYSEIEGTASFAALFVDRNYLLLATNNGSLYVAESRDEICAFASERTFLERCVGQSQSGMIIRQIPAGQYLVHHFDQSDADRHEPQATVAADVAVSGSSPVRRVHVVAKTGAPGNAGVVEPFNIIDSSLWKKFDVDWRSIRELKRCSSGVLPETMPFISFDKSGVSNYTREYRQQPVPGKAVLESKLASLKQGSNSKFLVAFSGGRDSSYALYYLKRELGLDVVAFTYDWGMITDLARRNQARLCGKLGIEHIVVSADIAAKRRNIRSNVLAWLKRPHLGTIPLFMAGDKQYFYHANRLQKEVGAAAIILAANPLEKTHFKAGFCGVPPAFSNRPPVSSQFTMLSFYAREFLKNPAYVNASLIDTAGAYLSYYTIPHDYLRIFDFIRWDEDEIDATLKREFQWELATDTRSTWRIGDGTAAFYNYIFLTVAGFTENDSLRHNQVMEGDLTRSTALEYVEMDNHPRFESIHWYCRVLDLDPLEVLGQISRIPRLYGVTTR